ncbi:MAG: sugar transferase [Solirubrobacterales bacterium]|nr:sugar transferase [Solirubrobacterales bacterium]
MNAAQRGIKRLIDLTVGLFAVVVTAPVLAICAIAIRLDSKGPVLYRQPRAGLNGHEFEIVKLRTMIVGAEHSGAGMAVDHNDSRITRVGGFLRRWSLDELPNLVNVVKGEMSLVGPRPTLLEQVAEYDERQRGRLSVRPGVSGWAQVQGRASLPWSERIELDLWYINHQSLGLDLKILIATVRLIFTGEGLYRGERGGWDKSA